MTTTLDDADVDFVADRVAADSAHVDGYAAWAAARTMAAQHTRFVSGLARGARILDAGCGTGRDLAAFTEAGFQTVGVDLNDALLAHAENLTSSSPLLRADLRCLVVRQPRASDAG